MSDYFSASEIDNIEKRIGYVFENKNLLKSALTHTSYRQSKIADPKIQPDRLEFLGASVMNLIVADRAFEKLLNIKEGGLRRLRSKLLKDSTCSQYFDYLKLAPFVKMSPSEKDQLETLGNDRLATTIMQALVAAVYKDGGMKVATKFFNSRCLPAAKAVLKDRHFSNWRRKLQELCHKKLKKQPSYVLLGEEGPEHSKLYKIGIFMDDDLIAKATGRSKKIAATKAASKALEKI